MLYYSQSTGTITRAGKALGTGFAGNNFRADHNPTGIQGRNNPAAQNLHWIGPLPQGVYDIGPWGNAKTVKGYPSFLGPNIASLTQVEGETFGRSGFFIHGAGGDDPSNASEGCICLDPMLRLAVSQTGEKQITVTA